MTQEEIQLLLKDLSARLQHKVRIKIGEYSDYTLVGIVITDEKPIKVEVIENGIPYKIEVSPDIIKPHLRPMSSMTEEEIDKLLTIIKEESSELIEQIKNNDYGIKEKKYHFNSYKELDWILSHHFDYRGLIEEGLALEASEGMYNTKEQ